VTGLLRLTSFLEVYVTRYHYAFYHFFSRCPKVVYGEEQLERLPMLPEQVQSRPS
jgi:hypothetical protein